MKLISMLLLFVLLSYFASAQKVVFLHHSTGGNVFYEGNVAGWISDYNATNNTNFEITERAYPDSPWPWENYPYDYWKLWIDSACNSEQTGIECLASIAQQYDVIIFKHCFPGAGILANNGAGDITSSEKTIPNYKLQYRALRELYDQYPNNKFIAWTLAPLHRLATTSEEAARANEFANWVKNEWLIEDGKNHPNIFVFDFYGVAAELNSNPAPGQQYCLKYEYEGSHDGNDSHPNKLANQTIGPIFAQRIVDVALAKTESNAVSTKKNGNMVILPNPVKQGEEFTLILPPGSAKRISIYDGNGQLILAGSVLQNQQISTQKFNKGIYLVTICSEQYCLKTKLIIK